LALLRFAVAQGVNSLAEAAASAASANRLLVSFVQAEFKAGAKIHVAKHEVLGLQYYFRELKGKLHDAWDALESWGLEVESNMRLPMDVEVLRPFLGAARLFGLRCWAERKRGEAWAWFVFASLCEAGFFGSATTRRNPSSHTRKDSGACPVGGRLLLCSGGYRFPEESACYGQTAICDHTIRLGHGLAGLGPRC
jgi:hypothetical protein